MNNNMTVVSTLLYRSALLIDLFVLLDLLNSSPSLRSETAKDLCKS